MVETQSSLKYTGAGPKKAAPYQRPCKLYAVEGDDIAHLSLLFLSLLDQKNIYLPIMVAKKQTGPAPTVEQIQTDVITQVFEVNLGCCTQNEYILSLFYNQINFIMTNSDKIHNSLHQTNP